MNADTIRAIYDEVLPGRRDAPLVGGNRSVTCPLHEDHNPSLDLDEEKLVWTCRAGCDGGGAVDLAGRVLGEERTKQLLREIDSSPSRPTPVPTRSLSTSSEARQYEVEDLNEVTEAQRNALNPSDNLREGSDALDRIGGRFVRVRRQEAQLYSATPRALERDMQRWKLELWSNAELEA
jgi:hypothetical protein